MIINLHFLLVCFSSFISIIASSSPPLNFTVYGTADVNHTSIILTQNLHNCTSNAQHSNIGRVFYKNPIRFLDSSFNSTVSFSTRFSFIIIPPPPLCLAGEGVAFLITSDSNSLPHSVGCIGLPKSIDQLSDSSFLAVEFDTSFDQGLGDINDNHVGIDVDSIFSIASVDLMSTGIDLKSGKRITAWIEYRNSEKIIQIWVGYTQIKPENPILVAPLDISKRFNGFMYVGFSASNGRGSATHLIDNWRLKTSESVPPNIEVETVKSENCLICFPEDSGKDEEDKKGSSNHHHYSDKRVLELALGLLGLNVILILLTVCLVLLYVCFMKRRNPSKKPTEEPQICSSRFQENRMPRRLKLSEIRSATKGFCRNQIVSEGVSAILYEASLPSCGNVAVKRFINANKTSSFEGQFVTEFVKMAGSLRHRNLVQLQGWCCEKKELILVYEFITNGSLDKILHHPTPANNSLSFDARSKILLGVSSALVYLHEECEKPIIHRN
ncbi:Concanavalin A-like lectin/glucanase superfamily, partial [Cynara cardunculus var. scolymus]